ncbi:GMC family oxidoreductase, partial [Patulibacter sp. S7RM1-6]
DEALGRGSHGVRAMFHDSYELEDSDWSEAILADFARLGTSYDWGFDSAGTYPDQTVRFERSRVLGGCSTHNGAVQTWGHRRDYDDWVALGNPGWGTDDLLPLFRRASEQLRVVTHDVADLTPFQAAWFDAAPTVGLPQLRDLNDLDETVGVAPESVNVVDGLRWNNAFAYLDPHRAGPHLRIVGDALVDRLLLDGARVAGVVVRRDGAEAVVRADRVVLAGGAYGTPAVLLRSGVGPADALRALDVPVALDLPGVGENLHDQPFALLTWEGSDELAAAMDAAGAGGAWLPDEQTMAKAASSRADGLFDLHVLPYSPTRATGRRAWCAGVGALLPRSRGHVRLASRDPEALPIVDHRFLEDEDGHDLTVLAEGIELLRELAGRPALARLLGRELTPGPAAASREELRAHLLRTIDNYWHPVGTCRMGPDGDPLAVCDHRGRVRGLEGCVVADAALMPVVPRATTAMPITVVGERVAQLLLEDGPSPAAPDPKDRPA